MFKNIELSEINRDNVVRSLWILVGLTATFMFGSFLISIGLGNDEFSIGIVFFMILQVIFIGWTIWVPILLILFFAERMVLGKKSTTKTVLHLFLFEMIFPLLLLITSIFSQEFDGTVLFMVCGVFISQWIRWNFLKRDNRMYNFIP